MATIVLVHGLWLTPLSFEHVVGRYTDQGHRVLAPAWPGMEVGEDALRRDPSPMNGLGVVEVADHYERIIRDLDEPPVIMGHSCGGVITQILLGRGLGAAGVAFHSAPVKGVLRLPVNSLRSAFPVLRNPANRKRTVALTPARFHFSFANTVDRAESDKLYERYHVPTSGRPLWQAATANVNPGAATKVDFRASRAPLLLIAGGRDQTVPAVLNRENHHRYRKSPSVTEFREFPDRPHLTLATPGWEEVADHALTWALGHLS